MTDSDSGDSTTNAQGLSDQEIAEVRSFIGRPLRIEQWNREASYDSIRHWCLGIGDHNPLWIDEEYAKAGPYGTMVAPPTFVFSVFGPSIRPGLPGFPSIQGGGRLEVTRYPRRGERIVAAATLLDVHEKQSAKIGRFLLGIGQTTYATEGGDHLATYTSRGMRIPAPKSDEAPRLYEPQDPYHYSAEELRVIETTVLNETRRGSEPLWWEDVDSDTSIPTLVRGPLDFPTMVAFYAGNGPGTYVPINTAWHIRQQTLVDPSSRPDNAPYRDPWGSNGGTGHDDPSSAHASGMPGAFDVGWQRISWMIQVATDWVGDHGRLKTADIRLTLPNVLGDTTWCTALVTSKRVEGNDHLVDIRLTAQRQDGAITASGEATAILPSRTRA